jgi:hypothetical protein
MTSEKGLNRPFQILLKQDVFTRRFSYFQGEFIIFSAVSNSLLIRSLFGYCSLQRSE